MCEINIKQMEQDWRFWQKTDSVRLPIWMLCVLGGVSSIQSRICVIVKLGLLILSLGRDARGEVKRLGVGLLRAEVDQGGGANTDWYPRWPALRSQSAGEVIFRINRSEIWR